MSKLDEIRSKYPEYAQLDDQVLAERVHSKFYSDLSFDDFASKIGYENKTDVINIGGEDLEVIRHIPYNWETGEAFPEPAEPASPGAPQNDPRSPFIPRAVKQLWNFLGDIPRQVATNSNIGQMRSELEALSRLEADTEAKVQAGEPVPLSQLDYYKRAGKQWAIDAIGQVEKGERTAAAEPSYEEKIEQLQPVLEASREHIASIAKERSLMIDVPEAANFGEKMLDAAAGVTAFVLQLKVLGKTFSGMNTPMLFEMQNQLTGGTPGTGYAMGQTFQSLGSIRAKSGLGIASKIAMKSGTMAGIAAVAGGDEQDVLIAAMIPIALELPNIPHYAKVANRYQKVKALRKQASANGFDTSNIPDSALEIVLNAADLHRQAQTDLRSGKITRAEFEMEMASIADTTRNVVVSIINEAKPKGVKTPEPKPASQSSRPTTSDIVAKVLVENGSLTQEQVAATRNQATAKNAALNVTGRVPVGQENNVHVMMRDAIESTLADPPASGRDKYGLTNISFVDSPEFRTVVSDKLSAQGVPQSAIDTAWSDLNEHLESTTKPIEEPPTNALEYEEQNTPPNQLAIRDNQITVLKPDGPVVRWASKVTDKLHKAIQTAQKMQTAAGSSTALPKDPAIRKAYVKLLGNWMRSVKAIDPNSNKFKGYVSSRFGFMDLDSKTGIVSWPIWDEMYKLSGRAAAQSLELANKIVPKDSLTGITREDNDNIAKWLYYGTDSEAQQALKQDAWDSLTAVGRQVATSFKQLLSSPFVVKNIQLMRFRRWDKTGSRPPDIDTYFPASKQPRGSKDIHSLLLAYRAAVKDGQVLEFINSLPMKLGIREAYYLTEDAHTSTLEQDLSEFKNPVREGAMEESKKPYEEDPSLIAREAHTRKAEGKPREGSVANNILRHIQRVSIYNSVADLLPKLYGELRQVEGGLTDADKRVIDHYVDNLLGRPQGVDWPDNWFRYLKSKFWKSRLQALFHPHSAITKSGRNLLQPGALGTAAMDTSRGVVNLSKILGHTAKGGSLESYDPEMYKRYKDKFNYETSERYARLQEFLYYQFGDIVESKFGQSAWWRKSMALLDKSDWLYGGSDEMNRFMTWIAQYQTIKQYANEYLGSKKTDSDLSKFMNRSKLSAYRREQQAIAMMLLSEGRVDDLANSAADWATEDTQFRYRTEGRSGWEQTPSQRSQVPGGVYNFPRAYGELMWYHTIEPMYDGMRNGDYRKAWTGFSSFLKLAVTSGLASGLLAALGLRRAYNMWSNFAVSGVDPATGMVLNYLENATWELTKHERGEQDSWTTASNILRPIATGAEMMFIPLVDEIGDIYESISGTRGASLNHILGNMIKGALGKDTKKLEKVRRDGKQKLLHAFLGSYEYVEEKPSSSGSRSRPTRTRGR